MTSAFEIRSAKSGMIIRFEADYICKMEDRVVDADGYKVNVGAEPTTAGSSLVAYADGKRVASCDNPAFWGLIDIKDHPGCKAIHGLNILFSDARQAADYEAWIKSVMDAGTTAEVKEYRAAQQAKDDAEQIKWAEGVVAAAEAQADIPTKAEAQRRMKRYNDINNEGGEGYVPHIYDQDEYRYAMAILQAKKRG